MTAFRRWLGIFWEFPRTAPLLDVAATIDLGNPAEAQGHETMLHWLQ